MDLLYHGELQKLTLKWVLGSSIKVLCTIEEYIAHNYCIACEYGSDLVV